MGAAWKGQDPLLRGPGCKQGVAPARPLSQALPPHLTRVPLALGDPESRFNQEGGMEEAAVKCNQGLCWGGYTHPS